MSKRSKGNTWKFLREQVFRRDNHRCQKCGLFGQVLECDHVVPLEQGGLDHIDNLQTLCVACHVAKTAAENRTHQVKHQDDWAAFAAASPFQRARP